MYARYIDNKISVFDSFIHKETIKEITGREWNPENKSWTVPYSKDNLLLLQMVGCKFDEKLLSQIKEISSNKYKDKVFEPVEPMPLKLTPFSYQVDAYNNTCTAMGIFEGGGAGENF